MPAAREILVELRMNVSDGFIFRNRDGGPRQRTDVQRAYDKAVTRAGLPADVNGPVTFHALRHTAISRLANDPRVGVVLRPRRRRALQPGDHERAYVHKVEDAVRTAAAAEALGG